MPDRTTGIADLLPALLTGNTDRHLCSAGEAKALGAPIHRAAVASFKRLQAAARVEGFDLRILSGFRSFDRQRSIWNRKAAGELPVLDSNAVPLDIAGMSNAELVFAILRWSALPGASRHHWGTDLDVFDAAATPEGYEIELIPDEVDPGGMFGPLHEWLDERIAADGSFGFFRPYDEDRNGVAPERWHVSYVPLATAYLEQLTPTVLRAAVERHEIELQAAVLPQLEEIHARFVVNVAAAVR